MKRAYIGAYRAYGVHGFRVLGVFGLIGFRGLIFEGLGFSGFRALGF